MWVLENINQEDQVRSDLKLYMLSSALYHGELVLPQSLKVFYENNMDIEKFPVRKFFNHTCYFELFNED